jgi:hypothetical protein
MYVSTYNRVIFIYYYALHALHDWPLDI